MAIGLTQAAAVPTAAHPDRAELTGRRRRIAL